MISENQKRNRILLCFASIIMMTLAVFIFIMVGRLNRVFGKITLDQIIYHMQIPLSIIDPNVIKKLFSIWGHWKVMSVLFMLIIWILCNCVLIHGGLHEKIKKYSKVKPSYVSAIISFLSLLFCFFLFMTRFEVLPSLLSMRQKSTLIDETYAPHSIEDFRSTLDASQQKANLILIISESLESTYDKEELYGENLIPGLSSLKKQGDNIEDLYMTNGCNYTISAMYAMFYGLPLIHMQSALGTPISVNFFKDKCISLLDILSANGYQIAHFQSAPIQFAAHDKLFDYLPNAKAQGNLEISKEEIPERRDWDALWDRDLFEKAKKELVEMSKSDKSFFLSLLTFDTHFGNRIDPMANEKYHDWRDIVIYQGILIENFVKWIEEQPWSDNTVIVIVGDHCRMGVEDSNNIDDRRIFNLILHSKAQGNIAGRKAGMFDFAPTILDALGWCEWDDHSLGIGRSLYGQSKTIIEQYGCEKWNQESRMKSETYDKFLK